MVTAVVVTAVVVTAVVVTAVRAVPPRRLIPMTPLRSKTNSNNPVFLPRLVFIWIGVLDTLASSELPLRFNLKPLSFQCRLASLRVALG